MIDQVSGRVLAAGPTWVTLDLSGFGVRLWCPPATAASARIGESATFHTSFVVREDSMTLYGFSDDEERDAFELVMGVSGFGPKLALAVSSVCTPAALRDAVLSDDLATLVAVPGVGRKTAGRLVLELKDKVAGLGGDSEPALASKPETWRAQITDGLVGLGWSAKDAERACESVAELANQTPQPSLGELMRAALVSLQKS